MVSVDVKHHVYEASDAVPNKFLWTLSAMFTLLHTGAAPVYEHKIGVPVPDLISVLAPFHISVHSINTPYIIHIFEKYKI